MPRKLKPQIRLARKNAKLRTRLKELEEALRAIQNDEVDALVGHTDQGDRIFTLRGAESPYRIFVEKMYAGAATLGPDGTILYANESLARLLQTPLERVVGSLMSQFTPPENAKPFASFLEHGKVDGWRGEFPLLAVNRDIIPTYLSMTPVEIAGTQGACLLVADLREQKLLEESRAQVNIQDIERDLRSQFISALSHDLLNPLSAARTTAEMSLKLAENFGMRHRLAKKTLESIDRVDRMIRDFLDASRIKAGAPLPLTITEFDLRETLEKTVSDLKPVWGDRLILHATVPARGFWDFNALRRAIENLANNAIKYGAPNSPVVITLQQPQGAAKRVRIAFHNQGNVIPENKLARLFMDFSTMKIAKSGQRGWGIGLVLVRGVVQAHGGTVKAESDPKNGTTFTIEIPQDARVFQAQAA